MHMQRRPSTAILVVEDDLLVRGVIVEILEEAGFAPCEAASAEEALQALAKKRFDAVITDIDMPGEIDGVGLARHIGECKPEIGVVITSGRTPGALPQGMRFVPKPFTARGLLKSVAALLEERLYAAS